MALTIGSNIASLQAQRQLNSTSDTLGTVFTRLASGQRINIASDDAAGLAVANSLRTDARIFSQAIRNINDGITLIAIAEGALSSLGSITDRQIELASQAANGTYSTQQRAALKTESDALAAEFNRIIESTTFNGRQLLNASDDQLTLQVGRGDDATITVTLASLSAPVVAGDGTFQAAVSYEAGGSGVTTGDVNGDGILDIVSAGGSGDYVSVMFGNGDGTFQASASYGTTDTTIVPLLADIDGDGDLDIVASSLGESNVFLNNGDGSYQTVVTYNSGLDRGLALADFDKNGTLDIAQSGTSNFSFLSGNGDGTFAGETLYDTGGTQIWGLTAADFDGDGNMDVATANRGSQSMSIFLGNGNGTFEAAVTYASAGLNPRDVKAADLNGDGYLDLVTADQGGNNLSVFFGDGTGSFGTAQSLAVAGAAPNNVTLFDINEDGYIDILNSDFTGQDVGVYLGNGDGTFGAVTSFATAGANPSAIAVADVNGDSAYDLIVSASGTHEVSVLLANVTTTESSGSPTFNLLSQEEARNAIESIEALRESVITARGSLGVFLSRLEAASRVLVASRENYLSAESRIMDADIANESSRLIRMGILQQASSAVLAQANQQPALAIGLLSE